MRKLYIIAGCNGAGKTTASYTILPEILECEEFVNADEIARGLSPFRPERAGIQAGRLMLERIKSLIDQGQTFAFETTLATKSYKNLIQVAKDKGYSTTLLFFWLNSPNLAVKRVEARVKEGGHDIPEKVIRRRYENGLKNLFSTFKSVVDSWIFIDSSSESYELVAEKTASKEVVYQSDIWNKLKTVYHE